ncbi:uncharacterized protein LOC113217698 [Frankliniella occidentalis]|uniref:Uncharacterized protein LOC113217698 n=1 Tax=Frankliniella occidentalis TaxID=133901 RepID=A0A9C6XDI6_FRAOC|nr:uncharacterized protein LOC113217698 [Frankliniella occidentalis]
MRVLDVVLAQARLLGLVTCISKPKSDVKPFRVSKRWILYSYIFVTAASINNILVSSRIVVGTARWTIQFAIPTICVIDTVTVILVVCRQHRDLPNLLTALKGQYYTAPCPGEPVQGVATILFLYVSIAISTMMVTFLTVRTHGWSLAVLQALVYLTSVAIQVWECALFASLTHCLVHQYATVNAQLRDAFLPGEATPCRVTTLGRTRHDLVMSLRRRHLDITALKDRMWHCFHLQVFVALVAPFGLPLMVTCALRSFSLR